MRSSMASRLVGRREEQDHLDGTRSPERRLCLDLPGLLRELLRLLTGIVIPPGAKRLFCSSFLQAVYRLGLGAKGDFNAGLVDANTTPMTAHLVLTQGSQGRQIGP